MTTDTYARLDLISEIPSKITSSCFLRAGDRVTFAHDPKIYEVVEITPRGFHIKPLPTQTKITKIWFDELAEPIKNSPKRKQLIAQLERAKMRRDKNAVRDLTRQLEKVW